MAKASKKGKKKAPALPQEPPHDPNWERTVISGRWDRPVTALPDANTWPSWGALRERVVSACREIRVPSEPSLRDAFAAELVKLSPPLLRVLDLGACHNLHKFVLSPSSACPALDSLSLAACPGLEYVLVQSSSLTQLDLSGCEALTKVLVQCPRLRALSITGCPRLEVLMLWSDELHALDLTGAATLARLELHAPALNADASNIPALPDQPVAVRPTHPPIAAMLRENVREAAQAAAEAREREWRAGAKASCGIPAVYRSACA